MAKDNSISVVIITRNEEKNIVRCLDSLIGVADEIIIVDSYSEDNTPKICSERKVRFVQTEWLGYSETKNYANSLAGNAYILSLDADEALSIELQAELVEIKNSGFDVEAYRIKRLTNYCGHWIYHSGWYPDWKLRLWKKEKGQWKGDIHEKVELSEQTSIGKLKSDILHYSYYSINEHIQQMISFTDLMAKDYYQKNMQIGIGKLIFSPIVKFFRAYLFLGGFRDGFYGIVICTLSSMATFLKYGKTIQLQRRKTM